MLDQENERKMKQIDDLDLMMNEYIDKKQKTILDKKLRELEERRVIKRERQERLSQEFNKMGAAGQNSSFSKGFTMAFDDAKPTIFVDKSLTQKQNVAKQSQSHDSRVPLKVSEKNNKDLHFAHVCPSCNKFETTERGSQTTVTGSMLAKQISMTRKSEERK